MEEEIQNGLVHISDDAVSSIIGHVVMDTPGIAGMSGSSISKGWAKRLGGKNVPKGMSVEVTEADVAINLRIIVHYGCIIQEVCYTLQQNVRDAVEGMMGLTLAAVNVKVEKIAIP
ncbi:Asp23/Gls24 family envelope stress response protein [Paenibacillus albidus]|uniref:Asp23/Gls24 family envelope stress response protein n=1 Tax=Paenibacillus albidus TaxID=2041023 RepID=UPI001BE546F2|nr:Asp23/Gls24 family envelope stress response protein [Paenibacillus albidus]MBT2293694.1 Asp23/Gls24 family envelope stress response protein [Paenibacillus albidus]